MNLINFIVWLSAGAFIGWFAGRMVKTEYNLFHKPLFPRRPRAKKS